MDVFIRALPRCDSLRYVTSEVLIGVLHVRINHSLTHIRSIQWRIQNFSEVEGGGGGGGGGADCLRSDMKSVCVRGWEGGMQSASGPIRKVGAFGNTANTLSLITNGYNFGRGGCSSTRSTFSRADTGFSNSGGGGGGGGG